MHDNYNILENLLQRSRFHSSKEDVLYLIDLLYEEFGELNLEIEPLDPKYFYLLNLERYPNKIIYFEAYLHNSIDRIITYLVIDRLTRKNIDASIKQVHEICFYAQFLFNNERAENYTHAINSAIKVFVTKDWEEPYGFIDEFPEYLDNI